MGSKEYVDTDYLIKMYDAIKAMTEAYEDIDAEWILKRLPSYGQLRKGKWSDISGQAVLCSACGRAQNYKQTKGWRYCPHCGSRNEH